MAAIVAKKGEIFYRRTYMRLDWIRNLTLLLLFSAALNVALGVALVGARRDLEREKTPIALPLVRLTCRSVLEEMSKASFRELTALLTDKTAVEEGYLRRDLALSSLVFHHQFDLEKGIGSSHLPKGFAQVGGKNMPLWGALSDDHFDALIRFAYHEAWPFTAEGLFLRLGACQEDSLLKAFCLTPEFHAVETLFPALSREAQVGLARESGWELISSLAMNQSKRLDLTEQQREKFLQEASCRGSKSAELLLHKKIDPPFEEAIVEKKAALHIVQPHENLWKIARLYHVTVEDLIEHNHFSKDQKMSIGQVVKVPLKQGEENRPLPQKKGDSGKGA